MDEEQAINYIGKTVYVVDFHTDEIQPRKVKSAEEVSNHKSYQYKLFDENHKVMDVFYDKWEDAHKSLIEYCELRVDVGVLRLNGVMEMEE